MLSEDDFEPLPASPSTDGEMPKRVPNVQSASLTEDDFEPISALPRGVRTQSTLDELGLTESQARVLYDMGDDATKIRVATAFGADVGGEARRLAGASVERDVESLVFPEGDAKKIAESFRGDSYYTEHRAELIETMLKEPDGAQRVKDLWTADQTDQILGRRALEYQAYVANAINSTDAVLLADLRRLAEDTFGGRARAGYNLFKDAGASAMRGLNQGVLWAGNAAVIS